MAQSNGLEAKISTEETRITIMTELHEIFPHLIKFSLQGRTSHIRTIVLITEDHMINA